jgi:hypothetical protein
MTTSPILFVTPGGCGRRGVSRCTTMGLS